MQHAMRMRRVMLSCVACPALQYVSTLSRKRHDLKKKLLNIQPVFLFSLKLLPETFLIVRRIERHMIKNYIGLARFE
jgi:hypothetical protein